MTNEDYLKKYNELNARRERNKSPAKQSAVEESFNEAEYEALMDFCRIFMEGYASKR